MSGPSIRSLRQLALGSSQAVRPTAATFTIASTSSRNPTARVLSTAAVQATRLPKPKKPTTQAPKPTTPPVVPYKRYRQPKPELTKFPEGHGEQIWVYNNIVTNQVVYSHTPVLRSNRALKQLPFNGKKTKPAKLRKDYWRPMALIQFGEGEGVVGQSVFQKLREFRRLHELSWGHQKNDMYALDRKALGEALNDQRANSIADMAAVLAGAGQGNRIQVRGAEASASTSAVVPADGKLAEAIVFWANDQDRNIAGSWSKNVRHAAGLPPLTRVRQSEEEEVAAA
ncbi:hypothetical protein SPBR_03089 [Sporothrix brasiliensis 5110]|uniref:Large ribosomal subunit protein mL67 n=1 Tax=Sporothrix brasiliensis 5110 TaxID=1398154 RepID=A0A0C2J548_9PEZI|nr:uncharacterized protein SPBR_03089 [Sporothrix brasiliensis 5110]KIH92152.1 hypothetical protein SPBR_03089 [Sporothrix brasiliensis 5110]